MGSTTRQIDLPIGGIQIEIIEGGGTIRSSLRSNYEDGLFDSAIDGLESLILAHACAGVNIEDPEYIAGVQTALDACMNYADAEETGGDTPEPVGIDPRMS